MENKKHTLEWVKRQAKKLKKKRDITHGHALEIIAKSIGYKNYHECYEALKDDSEKDDGTMYDTGKPWM